MLGDRNECFVIMPFGREQAYQKFFNRYDKIVKAAVDGFRFKQKEIFHCVRADEVSLTGSITRDFLVRLWRAEVVIADLTGLNPNVFYELGVRHALRSGTILLAEDGFELPFDIKDLRVIPYRDTVGGEESAIQAIRVALRDIIENPDRNDSPVFHALSSVAEFGESSKMGTPEWLDGKNWKVRDGRISSPIDGIWLEILNRRERQSL